MSEWEQAGRTGTEVKCYIRFDAIDLLEVQSVEYSVDRKGRVGGAGIGHPRNRYHKFGVPEGSYSISKNWLNGAGEQAELFAKLISGVTAITTETVASGASSHTCSDAIVGVLGVIVTGGDAWTELVEGDDYTINYVTKVITFTSPMTNVGKVMYLTDVSGTDDDPLDGSNHPFIFDVEWRDQEGTVLKRLVQCGPYEHANKSGGIGEEPFTEDLKGNYLQLQTNPT